MSDLSRWTFDARWDDRNIDANDYMVRHPDGFQNGMTFITMEMIYHT